MSVQDELMEAKIALLVAQEAEEVARRAWTAAISVTGQAQTEFDGALDKLMAEVMATYSA